MRVNRRHLRFLSRMAADDADTPAPALQSFQEPPTAPPSRGIDITHGNSGRGELLVQARSFLTSPQVVHEDTHVKRRFLLEKGLTELEISNLIEDLVSSSHTIISFARYC